MKAPLLGSLVADLAVHTGRHTKEAPRRRKGYDVDAQVLSLVRKHPGSRKIDLMDCRPEGITEIMLAESILRLKNSGQIVGVRPVYQKPERYWTAEYAKEAAEFHANKAAETSDARVLAALRKAGRALYCAEISRQENMSDRTVGHALQRLQGKGLIRPVPAVGRSKPWQAVSPQ